MLAGGIGGHTDAYGAGRHAPGAGGSVFMLCGRCPVAVRQTPRALVPQWNLVGAHRLSLSVCVCALYISVHYFRYLAHQGSSPRSLLYTGGSYRCRFSQ